MEFSRRRSASARFVLAAALLLSTQVWAETQYFPIPAVGTSKNDGSDVGLIVPTLVTKPDGDLNYIVAPMLIYNTIVGARGTVNLFRYEPGGRELRFIGSLSERIERRVLLSYIDPAFSNGRYALSLGGTFFKNATARFFGLGPDTGENDQTNYTAREFRAYWKFGLHMNEVTQIAVGQRYRDIRLQRGATDLPFTVQAFPTVVGVQGATILGHRATFHYDTRDNLVSPTDGAQVTAYAELNQNLRNDDHPVFYRYELEAKKLFPSDSKRMVLVVRGDIQLTFGEQVPFYEQSSLGGQNNLRGYGVDRFIDKHLLVVNIEERIHVLRAKFLNVAAELEVAPFVDMGRVFNTFETKVLTNYRITPGIGFRAMVRPNVVGRVDYGYSKEGGAVFAGLDYPF
jgi:outer membrane protein assembly factor BamA